MSVRYTKRGQWIVLILLASTFVNTTTWVAGAFVLGGTAFIGHVEEGRYFVGDHGRVAEVTRPEWLYSYFHTAICIANVAAAFAVWVWLWLSGDIEFD